MSDERTAPDPVDGLTERERLVANEMLFSDSSAAIGKNLGLAKQTVWDIMQRPHVRSYVAGLVEHVRAANQRLITSAVGKAITTLVEVCDDKDATKQVRVNAASALLRSGLTQRHEVSGPNGAPVQTMQIDPTALEGLSEEELVVARKVMAGLVR